MVESSKAKVEQSDEQREGIIRRMREIMELRKWTGREWARRAGLAENNHVNLILGRESVPNLLTAAALAEAAGVRIEWLASGEEPMFAGPGDIGTDARYPSRACAIGAARLVGISPEVIERVQKRNDLTSDPGSLFWLALLQAEEQALGNREPVDNE